MAENTLREESPTVKANRCAEMFLTSLSVYEIPRFAWQIARFPLSRLETEFRAMVNPPDRAAARF